MKAAQTQPMAQGHPTPHLCLGRTLASILSFLFLLSLLLDFLNQLFIIFLEQKQQQGVSKPVAAACSESHGLRAMGHYSTSHLLHLLPSLAAWPSNGKGSVLGRSVPGL